VQSNFQLTVTSRGVWGKVQCIAVGQQCYVQRPDADRSENGESFVNAAFLRAARRPRIYVAHRATAGRQARLRSDRCDPTRCVHARWPHSKQLPHRVERFVVYPCTRDFSVVGTQQAASRHQGVVASRSICRKGGLRLLASRTVLRIWNTSSAFGRPPTARQYRTRKRY
jgi:hypothetical protein